MSKARIWFALSAFLLASVATAAQTAKPEAPAVNLHGKIYMGIMALSGEVPDPEGDAHLPFYFAFGQEGNRLYGCSVLADQDKLTTPSAQAVNLTLTQWVLENGVVNGDQFTCDLYDEQGKSLNMGLKGKIQGGGEQIELYVKISILNIGPFYLYRCNENDHYSGIYVGKGDYTYTSPADDTPNNILLGIIVKPDGKMTFAALLYDPSDPGERYNFYGETDDFDPETGTFSYHGNTLLGEPDVDGYIGGGVMDLQVSSSFGYKAEATLYFFETEHKKPKLKKPKPISLLKGKTTSVKIRHRNVLRGTFISDNNPDVQISSFRYSQKYLYLDLVVASNASGKVKLTLTAPDGKKIVVKKQMKVK